tara:strand:- start:109756 stop:109902 length:147 start_codon:yes stop_codon:yes gene_type:complete
MNKKSLLNTNPYLSNAKERVKLLKRSVISSCGVEGIKVTPASLGKKAS